MTSSDDRRGDREAAEPAAETVGQKQVSEKEKRFNRLVEGRKLTALHDIHLIGNLSDRRHYEYGTSDVTKLFRELRSAVDSAEAKFSKALKVRDKKPTRTHK